MKIGVKTFRDEKFLDYFQDKADFFEVMAITSVNYDFLKKYSLPIIIHTEHPVLGIDYADKSLEKENTDSVNFARKLADELNSKKIIVHFGSLYNKDTSSAENALEFLKKINDTRILIENVYPVRESIGCLPEELEYFTKNTKKGFCLDINHAIFAAEIFNLDYLELIKELLKLNPSHFHIGGQRIKNRSVPIQEREHLSLKESDFDLKKVLSLLPKDAEITIETKKDIESVEEDLKLLRQWIKEIE